MPEPKPMASLSSGLLARKGDARPAVRRAFIALTSITPLSLASQKVDPREDVEWNAKTRVSPKPSPAPISLVVKQLQERIANTLCTPVHDVAGRPAPRPKPRVAFTLRIEPERHLRLRLAKVIGHRSAQQIVTQALDEFLEKQPGLEAMLAEVRQSVPRQDDA